MLFLRRQPRYVNWLIKVVIALFFGILLWYDVFQRENFQDIKRLFLAELKGDNTFWLYSCCALMPLNWAAETVKWGHLVRRVQPIGFWQAFRAVFAGVTTSLFLPNRVGDFGGRILFLKSKNAVKVVLSTFVGSWAQQLILITFGFLGFAYFLLTLWKVEAFILDGIIALGLGFVIILLFMFLNLEIVVPVFKKIRLLYRFPKLIKSVNVLRQYTREELLQTLLWAFIRYVIYTIQYFLILRFFGIEVGILRGASCIATIYLLQTSIPLPPIVGLLARGEVALKIWGMFSENELSILAATFTLWVINLIVPALIGLVFILQLNVLKSLGYEKKLSENETKKSSESN
ncbi:MAG: flippase-like domain-containing protein [Saprospiraceae bacterium]|nr:flippase-like domain-containing protein [Saprospiraceae bacterium]